MFRYAFSAAFAISLMLISVSAKSEWIQEKEDPDVITYIDPTDMVNKDGFVVFRILLSFKEPIKDRIGTEYRSIVGWFLADCNKKVFKATGTDFYYEPMATGKLAASVKAQEVVENSLYPKNPNPLATRLLSACK